MFYSHGDGFVAGSGASGGQDGANLARNFDVVVVETNHRFGLMGFLYLDELGGADDTERAIWGATHRNAWKAIAERPYLAGAFVWTGFDYRGEPTPFN